MRSNACLEEEEQMETKDIIRPEVEKVTCSGIIGNSIWHDLVLCGI